MKFLKSPVPSSSWRVNCIFLFCPFPALPCGGKSPSQNPQLSDLRESGAIEQDADVVLMMYREDYYEEDTARPGITDLYVRKHRHGDVGRVELMFKKNICVL